MNKRFISVILFSLLFILHSFAQDDRSQIPSFMQKTYFEVNVGAINYPFGPDHLEDGYTLVSAVVVPPTAVRLVLFGYDFTDYLSAQITYMRPVLWVKYGDVKADASETVFGNGTVRMNIGGLTLKPHFPIGKKFSVYGEAGLGIVTRNGFEYQGKSVVTNDSYSTMLYGAGFKYHINKKWALQLVANYSPKNEAHKQPYTSFIGTGFSYNYRAFTPERLEKAKKLGYIHPKQWIQLGVSSNVLGYGVNNLVSDKIPIFWGGAAEVRQGITLNYQRNLFHGPKVFAFDLGVEAGQWQTNVNPDNFFTLSVYPVFRLNYLRTKAFDAYFYYSIAAPAFISKTLLDGHKMGEVFTFQDNMGTGVFFGKERKYNAEIKIGHYSNGNIFPDNEAVKIPLSLNVGYAF